MRVLILTFGPRGDVELLVGRTVRVRARGAPCDTVTATEGRDTLVATGVLPSGGWL